VISYPNGKFCPTKTPHIITPADEMACEVRAFKKSTRKNKKGKEIIKAFGTWLGSALPTEC
jgi:hypothetical protein